MEFTASFEDLLPLLIGVGWILYSALKGGKKKQEKKTPVEQSGQGPSGTASFLDNFFEELTGLEQERKKEPLVVKEEKTNEEKKIYSFDDVVEKEDYHEERLEERQPLERYEEEKSKVSVQKKSGRKPAFDLKKAFIYSEILKKKYI